MSSRKNTCASFVFFCLAISCGESKAPVVNAGGPNLTPRPSNQGGSSSSCVSENDCIAASMELSSVGLSGNKLHGYVDEEVSWSFKGFDTNDGDRRVVLLINNFPAGSAVDPPLTAGQLSNTMRIQWKPTTAGSNGGEGIQIYMRDLDRCEKMEKNIEDCQKLQTLEYDRVTNFEWEIASRDITPSPSPTPTPTPTTQDCSMFSADDLKSVVNGVQGIQSLSSGDMNGMGGLMDMIGSLVGVGGKALGNSSGSGC